MTGSGNVACDNGVGDSGVGETAGMAGICNVPGNRPAFFCRCKDLAFVLVMILQVIMVPLIMVVMCCFFYIKELLARFGLILIYKKQSILPLHAM